MRFGPLDELIRSKTRRVRIYMGMNDNVVREIFIAVELNMYSKLLAGVRGAY